MAENCAVLQQCYKDRKRRTEIEPVKGYGWYYALLVCYDGYDTEQFYHQQPSDCYELFELMNNTDFYDLIVEYYEGNEEVKMYKKGECDEVDAKDRNVPFKGFLEGEVVEEEEEEGDSESDSEGS
jgi:hypothetical protein